MILTLDAALGPCAVGLVQDGSVTERRLDATRGNLARLPLLAAELLNGRAQELAFVAVTIGPGSFTGIRAGLALAHGIALAVRCPILGVTLGAALYEPTPGRALWTAIAARPGRIFLERDGIVTSLTLDSLPTPGTPIALNGNAAEAVQACLAGHDVVLLPAHAPTPDGIAQAASRTPLPPQPLYVDPPEARLP